MKRFKPVMAEEGQEVEVGEAAEDSVVQAADPVDNEVLDSADRPVEDHPVVAPAACSVWNQKASASFGTNTDTPTLPTDSASAPRRTIPADQ